MNAAKKIYGSKSRREKEAQEFKEKIILREETEEILSLIHEKKKEIDVENQRIATLFIESNTKQSLLKDYINYINKKIFSGTTEINKQIETKAEDIEKAIVELQSKMQIVIKYTKSEMDHQITQKFKDAEKRQRIKMLNKIEEGNDIIRNLNHMRLELEQLKIEFEEMNTKCEKYIEQNEKLKVTLGDQKSDNKNLEKKLNQIIKENQELKMKYNKEFNIKEKKIDDNIVSDNSNKDKEDNKDNNTNKSKTESKKDVDVYLSNEEESKNMENKDNVNNDENNNNNEIIPNNENKVKEIPEEYYPHNLILILKESIKAFHKDINELIVKITDEKKERNEASQLLQKCIDDINSEIKGLTRNSLLPNIKPNYLTYGYDNNIKSPNQGKVTELEMKLVVLTFIYDNIFQNIMNKNLYFISKNNPEKTYSKIGGFKKTKNFRKTAY